MPETVDGFGESGQVVDRKGELSSAALFGAASTFSFWVSARETVHVSTSRCMGPNPKRAKKVLVISKDHTCFLTLPILGGVIVCFDFHC